MDDARHSRQLRQSPFLALGRLRIRERADLDAVDRIRSLARPALGNDGDLLVVTRLPDRPARVRVENAERPLSGDRDSPSEWLKEVTPTLSKLAKPI